MNISKSDALIKLEKELKENRLIIFAGSGVSIDSNLPTWQGLVEKLVVLFRSNLYLLDSYPSTQNSLTKLLDDCDKTLAKGSSEDFIKIISVLKMKTFELDEVTKKEGYSSWKSEFRNLFSTLFSEDKFDEWHEVIVKTNYSFIITTNYDRLFEEAAKKNSLELARRSYSQDNADKIAESIYLNRPSIIHMHGKADATDLLETLVLTAEDYVLAKKKYAGFTLAIQLLLMRYSVLFVGYGGEDRNVETLFMELSEYFNIKISNKNRDSSLPKYYLIKKEDDIDNVNIEYKESYGIDIISTKDYSEQLYLLKELQAKFPR